MSTSTRRKTSERAPLEVHPLPQLPPQLLPWERDLLLAAFARLLGPTPVVEASDAPSS